MLAYLRKCKCNTQTMLNREYSKGILCHAALCTQETKHKARCIAGQCADERLLRTRRVMWTRDATMLLYDTVDFLKKGVAARCAEWNICRRGNCCRRLKIDAACCASIRINAPVPPIVAIGRITCNASRQNYRNHTNDKIFAPYGNFASSTMARNRGTTIQERVLSLIAIRHYRENRMQAAICILLPSAARY